MRVTEELDALAVMGIPHSLRLILPKVIGLSIAMPLVVLWTSAIALMGGMVSAEIQLGLGYQFFFNKLIRCCTNSKFMDRSRERSSMRHNYRSH